MKKVGSLLMAALLTVLFAGCTVVRELPATDVPAAAEADRKLGGELLKHFLAGDADKVCALLPDDLREKLEPAKVRESRKAVMETLGTPVSYRYVTAQELPNFTMNLWAVRFRRVNDKTGKEFHSEALFRVITGTVDGKPVILTYSFL